MRRAGGWACLAVIAACGGSKSSTTPAAGVAMRPARAVTGAETLLGFLPPDADLVIELDIARLRANPVVGPVVGGLLAGFDSTPVPGAEASVPIAQLWEKSRAIVLAAYQVGEGEATTLTVVDGAPPGVGEAVAEGVTLLAPPAWRDRAQLAAATGKTMAEDEGFFELRAQAMPAAAEGAVVRFTARLDFDARVALASALGIDAVPRTVSFWSDVADDAAAVALFDGSDDEDGGGDRLVATVEKAMLRLAADPRVFAARLSPPLRGAEIIQHDDEIKVVLVVGPKRLERAMQRLALAPAPVTP